MLADYAVRVENSRGRRHPEPPHPYRNDFQRDRDRVVHARAFRRLEAKTQVFTRRYSDHFRNRLTHTIEVAQISRTIAAQLGLNTDLVEALALVHDLGHPPFRPLRRKSARHGHAAARAFVRSQSARAPHCRRLRTSLRVVSRAESDLRSPRGHHQALARLRLAMDIRNSPSICSISGRRSKRSSST